MLDLMLVSAMMFGGADLDKTPPALETKLEGSWKVVMVVDRGTVKPGDGVAVEVRGDKVTTTFQNKKLDAMTIQVKPGTPGSGDQIDATMAFDKSKTVAGIFVLEGDNLLVCFGENARPTQFRTDRNDHIVYFLQRMGK